MMYHPEMGESPEPRLFATQHNYGRSYCCTWPASCDEQARRVLRELKIRPLKCSPIRAERLGDHDLLRHFDEDGFSCLISSKGHRKLMDQDLCASRALLD